MLAARLPQLAVQGLIIVTSDDNRAVSTQQIDESSLERVKVLIFVDQNEFIFIDFIRLLGECVVHTEYAVIKINCVVVAGPRQIKFQIVSWF